MYDVKYKVKWFGVLVGGLMSLVLLAGCSSDSDDNIMSSTVSEKANIRVVHTSFDAPAVDIWVNGAVAISGLSYRETSGYAELNAGSYNVKVTPAGASAPVVIDADVALNANTDYTVFATGRLADIGALISEDKRIPNSSKAKVRFMHASPDAPAVDIKVNSGSGPSVFSNISFDAITGYTEVDAGNYSFVVTPAGSETEVVVFSPIALAPATVYTVVAFGTLDPLDSVPFTVRAFVDNQKGIASADFQLATSTVNVTHASPDAPAVHVLVDDIVVTDTALTYPNSTGYLTINAGTRNIKVNASGSSMNVIDNVLTLHADKSYSVFAVNFLSNIEPLILEDDLSTPEPGKAHIRFLHASPDAPTVDITLTDGTTVFNDIAFKSATPFTPLDAGSYNLQVRTADGVTVVLNLPGIVLENGKIYTVFAKGSLNGTGGENLGAEIISNN